jgi:hypothetical protein
MAAICSLDKCELLTCQKTKNTLIPFVVALPHSSLSLSSRLFCSASLQPPLSMSFSLNKVSDRPQLWQHRIPNKGILPLSYKRPLSRFQQAAFFVTEITFASKTFIHQTEQPFAATRAIYNNSANVDTGLCASILTFFTINIVAVATLRWLIYCTRLNIITQKENSNGSCC